MITRRLCYVQLLVICLVFYAAHRANANQLSFSLQTPEGREVSVELGTAEATVVCFLGTECPLARGYALKLNALQSSYADRQVRIVGVMSNRQDSLEDVAKYCEELKVDFPVVRDVGNLVADSYGATRTPEVFLLDSQLQLRYHGRVDDQLSPGVVRSSATRQDLAIAIDELLAGQPISIPETRVVGCVLGRISNEARESENRIPQTNNVTYTAQVARVLQRHCVECHRTGEIGPFAMDSYEEVVGWAATMLESIEDGRMPPWHADPRFGEFSNARLMPNADKQILRDWIAGGFQYGESHQLPQASQFVDGWNLPRAPDLIVDMNSRPFTVPKDGVVEYQYFVADPGFAEDTWVSAAQVIPGARSVVHHAIVFVRPPDGEEFQGIGWLTAYIPGQRVHGLPAGHARKVPAGSKLVFQMHYTTNGMEQNDLSKVGLMIANRSEVTHEVFTTVAIDQEFEIPPHESNFLVRAQTQGLPAGAELLAITPHMHFRGKSFTLFAKDRPEHILLSVPRYDFNWQHTYQLSKPARLDELRGLEFEAGFDNSEQNPFNPDPTQTVTWGDQTWEEMAIAFFEIARPRQPVATQIPTAESPGVAEESAASKNRNRREQYVQRVFEKLDTNSDGEINKAEADIVVRHMHFRLWDLDGDNVATKDEVSRVAERLFH